MSDYENDNFENKDGQDEKKHLLRLSIDLLSVKDFKMSANIFVQYTIQLQKTNSFKSNPPTPVNQNQETKLSSAFATYEFQASKSELFTLLNDSDLTVKIMHQEKSGNSSEIGLAIVQMKEILQAPLKKTPQAVVRVCDQYLPIKDSDKQVKGLIRSIIYLEDLGEVVGNGKATTQTKSMKPVGQYGAGPSQQENISPNIAFTDAQRQMMLELEMFKRAEEAKFKAYLKQREIERIEEITFTWKGKEVEREKTFNDSLAKVQQLQTRIGQKGQELQKREERIIQLEEELKQKIQQVSRQLTEKEEETMNIKKRFKEERMLLEQDKKRLTGQLEDYKNKLEAVENKYYTYKKEIDESPLSILRNELSQKNQELLEMETKVKQANEAKEEFRKKFEQIKKDMITLKRSQDKEKEQTIRKQAEELENLKNFQRTKTAQEEERKLIESLKQQVTSLSTKLNETQKQRADTINERQDDQSKRTGTYNPFQSQPYQNTQSNIFLDQYARSQMSPTKQTNGMRGTNTKIDRLLKEKEELLSYGYALDDKLVLQLEEQIRQAGVA